jgi:hypothetical protein
MRQRGTRRIGWTLAAVVVTSLTAAPAAATDPPHEASSREAVLFLYTQGKGLMEAGKVREACEKFEDARHLDPAAINLLLRLGDCYEKLGRTRSAHAEYVAAVAVAARAHDPREAAARERALALAPRVPRLTLALPVESALPGLVILRDGVALSREEIGAAAAVDPGPHQLEARAPGKRAWSELRLVPAEGAAILVSIPRLADLPPPASAPGAEGSAGTRRTAGLVAGALGLAGIGVGAAFGVKAITGDAASREGHCDAQSACDPVGYDLRLDARRAGNASTALFAVGAAALGAGAALFFTARPSDRKGAPAVTVLASPGGVALGVRGAL